MRALVGCAACGLVVVLYLQATDEGAAAAEEEATTAVVAEEEGRSSSTSSRTHKLPSSLGPTATYYLESCFGVAPGVQMGLPGLSAQVSNTVPFLPHLHHIPVMAICS